MLSHSIQKLTYIFLCPLAMLCGCSSQPPPDVEFDIPALVGRSVDEVQWVLGRPTNDRLPSAGLDTSCSKTWKKERASLVVYYNSVSRRPLFFYLTPGTKSPHEDFRVEDGVSEKVLWTLGHLKRGDAAYEAHTVPTHGAPDRFLGLKVTPLR